MKTFHDLVSDWLGTRPADTRIDLVQHAEAVVRGKLDCLAVVYKFEDLDSEVMEDIGTLYHKE